MKYLLSFCSRAWIINLKKIMTKHSKKGPSFEIKKNVSSVRKVPVNVSLQVTCLVNTAICMGELDVYGGSGEANPVL